MKKMVFLRKVFYLGWLLSASLRVSEKMSMAGRVAADSTMSTARRRKDAGALWLCYELEFIYSYPES